MTEIADKIVQDIKNKDPFEVFDTLKSFEDGVRVQMDVSQKRGPVGGYKIAWNGSLAHKQQFGFERSGVGQIQQSEILPYGAVISVEDYSDLMIEPEIGAILACDLPADGETHTAETIAQCVERFVPAFEILDRRGGGKHGPSVLAGNIFNAGAVIGEPGSAPDGLLTGKVMVSRNGEKILWGSGTCPQNPMEALAYVVKTYNDLGHGLTKGQLVLCGSHTPLLAVEAGDDYVMTMVGLGEVRLSIR